MDGDADRINNRALFPLTAREVDAFRAIFGDGVKVLYAEEGGRTIGKKHEDRVRDGEYDGDKP